MKVRKTASLPADNTIKALGLLVLKAEGAEAAQAKPVFRITSEVLDRHDDRVKANSIDTAAYEANPVLLWNHDDWRPAIGTAKVYQEEGQWFMQPSFDGIGEVSKEVAAKVAAGTLRTCSIRFRVRKYAFNEEGGLDYEKVELLEISITNIPANPEAVRVKNQQPQKPQQKTKSEPEPTAEETASKALEQADLDAFGAVMDEKLKPLMEAIAALQAALGGASTEAKGEEEGDEEEKEEGGEDDDIELSAEEEEQLKSLFGGGKKK